MGATHSTRTVTISNDDVSFITLSDSLVKRMAGERTEESSGSPRSDNLTPAPAEPAPVRTVSEEPKQIHVIPGYSPISTMQLRREVEAARISAEKYWQDRIQSINANEEMARAIQEENFEKGIAEVQRAFKGYNTARYENPCVDKGNVLTQCYKDNPKQPLNCHSEVQAFSACVEQKHRNMMDART